MTRREVPHLGGIAGVLLAAGRSRRMGQNKLLLPWPADSSSGVVCKTVIAAAFDAIAGHCRDMIVVTGPDAHAVAEALQPRSFFIAHADPDSEMFDSLKAGLNHAMQLRGLDAVLLHLADHPQVQPQTIHTILAQFQSRPDAAVMPEFQGRGGHPVIIPRSLCSRILHAPQPGGLRQFWRDRRESCIRLPVDDPGVTADLDSPEDYQRRRVC